ncbi:MAG: hypothetical protein K8R25_02720 [Methanosarcinales archaeon]|nr:hypothetical protein [Methanosarcinales archaeon]
MDLLLGDTDIENHVIVLGYGDVGRQVIKHLTKTSVLFVVFDSDDRVFFN